MRRIDYRRIAPEAVSTILETQRYVDHCSLERPLLELARLRASQINVALEEFLMRHLPRK